MGKRKHNVYLLSWDNTGLETIMDLSMLDQLRQEEDQQRMIDILSHPLCEDPGNRTMTAINQAVGRIIMRARANPQRHYEIYTIQTVGSIAEKDLWDMFQTDPQGSADLIRERGNRVYSDRLEKHKLLIT